MNRRVNSTKNLITTVLVLWSAVSLAQQQHAFSIGDAIAYAHKNNVQIKNALLDYNIQEQTNRNIASAAFPQLNANLGTTYFPYVAVQSFPNFIAAATYGVLEQEGVKNGTGAPIVSPTDFGFVQAAFGTKWAASGGVSLSQILFDGTVFVGLQARKTSLVYAQKNVEVTEENIKVNVYKVYYQLVVSKTQMQQIDANIDRASKLLNDTKELFKNGFAENLDVNRSTVQLANLQTQKLVTQRSIDNGYLGLKILIGMPAKDSLALTDSISEEKIKEGIPLENSYQYSDRKEFQALQAATDLNQFNVKRYKNAYLPTANLNSNFAKQAYRNEFNFFGKGDWFNSWNIGFNVSIPIFSGFAKASNVEKAKLQLKQSQNLLENLKLVIDNDVEQAKVKFSSALAALETQRKNIELAEQVYNQTKKKYEAGVGSTTEITTAQTDLVTAQSNLVNALYDAIVARIDYQKATGKL